MALFRDERHVPAAGGEFAGALASGLALWAYGPRPALAWLVIVFLFAAGFSLLYRAVVRDRLGRRSTVAVG